MIEHLPQPQQSVGSYSSSNPVARLLVMACSAQKQKAGGLLPAQVRYDGPAFQVLRKYLKRASDPLTVLILSAMFGLIDADYAIPDYDCRITAERAEAIRPGVLRVLGERLGQQRFAEVAFCVGHDYQKAVEGYEACIPSDAKVTFVRGGQGTRLRNLRAWLRREQPPPLSRERHERGV